MKEFLKLYLVTDRELSLGRSLEEVVSEAIAGGVTMVQLREKDAATGEFIALAGRLMKILKPLDIPLIINDRVDIAMAPIPLISSVSTSISTMLPPKPPNSFA